MKLKTFVKATPANAFAGDVAELIEATDAHAARIASGDVKPNEVLSGAITVKNDAPKTDENGNAKTDESGNVLSDNSIDSAKRGFQAAARDAGKTARLLSITDNGDGTSDLEFTLSALIVRGKDETATDEETATDAEYPAADTESDPEPESDPETGGKRSRR